MESTPLDEFYDSEEDVFWGTVTVNEIKTNFQNKFDVNKRRTIASTSAVVLDPQEQEERLDDIEQIISDVSQLSVKSSYYTPRQTMQSQNTEHFISKVTEILDIQSTIQPEDNTNKLFSSISTETKIKEGSERTDNSFITTLTETTKESEVAESLDSTKEITDSSVKEANEITNNPFSITLQETAEKDTFFTMDKEITMNQKRSTLSTVTSYNTVWNQSNSKNSELLDTSRSTKCESLNTTDSSQNYESLDTSKAETESKPDNKRRSTLSSVMSYDTALDQSKNDKFDESRNDMDLGSDTQSDESLANVLENIIEKLNEDIEENISALNYKCSKGLFVRNDSIVTNENEDKLIFSHGKDESKFLDKLELSLKTDKLELSLNDNDFATSKSLSSSLNCKGESLYDFKNKTLEYSRYACTQEKYDDISGVCDLSTAGDCFSPNNTSGIESESNFEGSAKLSTVELCFNLNESSNSTIDLTKANNGATQYETSKSKIGELSTSSQCFKQNVMNESEIGDYYVSTAHDETNESSNDSILATEIQNSSNCSDVCMIENNSYCENSKKSCIRKSIEKSCTDKSLMNNSFDKSHMENSCEKSQSNYFEVDESVEEVISLSSDESINETKDKDESIREFMNETRDLEDMRISRNKNDFIVEQTPIKKEPIFYKNREGSVVEISSDSDEGTSYDSARSKKIIKQMSCSKPYSSKLVNSPISERKRVSLGLQRQAEDIDVSRDGESSEFEECSESEETQHNTDGFQRNTPPKSNEKGHSFSTRSSGFEKTEKSFTYEDSLEGSEQCNNKIEEKTKNETPEIAKNKSISSLQSSQQESPGLERNISILSHKNSPRLKKNTMSHQSPAFARNRNLYSYQDSPGFGTYSPLNANRFRDNVDKSQTLIEFERNERLCSGNVSINNYSESPIRNSNNNSQHRSSSSEFESSRNVSRDSKNESLGILSLSTKNLEHTMFLNDTRALTPNKSKNYSPRVNLKEGVFVRRKHELSNLLEEEDVEDDSSEEVSNAGVKYITTADNVKNKLHQSLEYSRRDERDGNFSEAAEQKFDPTEHDFKYSLEDEREGGYEEKHLYNLKHSLTQDGVMGINEIESGEGVELSESEYLHQQHNVSAESAESYEFDDTLEEMEMALKYGLDYKMPTQNDAVSHYDSLTSKQRNENDENRHVEKYESNRSGARRHFDSMDDFDKSISNESEQRYGSDISIASQQSSLKYGSNNSVSSLDNERTRHDGKYGLSDVKYGFGNTNSNKFIDAACRRDNLKNVPATQIKPISGLPTKSQSARKPEKPKMHSKLPVSKFSHIVSPISVYCNKPGNHLDFKKPTIPKPTVTPLNRFNKNHFSFNKIQSPVSHYIKNTPTAPLQQSNKTSSGANKQLFGPTKISRPISSSTSTKENVMNLPSVVYRPAAKAMISKEKELKFPHKIEKMIPVKTDIMKHQGRLVKHIDEQEVVERKLLTDDLTIANDSLDCSGVSSSDVSILTSKKAFIK